jgi:hypothetical protein
MLSLGVNIADTTIYDAVTRSFNETMTGIYYSECETNRTKDRVRHILAAPKVLVVHLQILTPVSKVYHALTGPDPGGHCDLFFGPKCDGWKVKVPSEGWDERTA